MLVCLCAACGTVIGSANTPQCFVGTGKKQACTLNGVNYEFFAVQYGSQVCSIIASKHSHENDSMRNET
jgi:hypothetical protein